MTQEENEKDKFAEELVYGFYKNVHIPTFARDIILYGSSRIVEVCDAHSVSEEDFAAIIELPSFKKEMREIRALTEASPNALIQLKARSIVEQGLEELQSIVRTGVRDADRINAMKLLAQIGGSLDAGKVSSSDDNKPQASGLVLNVQLGKNGSLFPPLPEGAQRPLRSVKEIAGQMEVIDVK